MKKEIKKVEVIEKEKMKGPQKEHMMKAAHHMKKAHEHMEKMKKCEKK